jgi:hypothetical protein
MLRRTLPPGLIARLDERTFIETGPEAGRTVVPDVRVIERGWGGSGGAAVAEAAEPLIIETEPVEITEAFIEVIDLRTGSQVITVIEFMSPANKCTTEGRKKYRQKQQELIAGGVHLVEVDLIRVGESMLLAPPYLVPSHRRGLYHICVTRAPRPFRHEVYPIRLQNRLPPIHVPLRPTDQDATLDLQSVFDQVYENGSYGYDVDYTRAPIPPLEAPDAAWATEMLAKRAGNQ